MEFEVLDTAHHDAFPIDGVCSGEHTPCGDPAESTVSAGLKETGLVCGWTGTNAWFPDTADTDR